MQSSGFTILAGLLAAAPGSRRATLLRRSWPLPVGRAVRVCCVVEGRAGLRDNSLY